MLTYTHFPYYFLVIKVNNPEGLTLNATIHFLHALLSLFAKSSLHHNFILYILFYRV